MYEKKYREPLSLEMTGEWFDGKLYFDVHEVEYYVDKNDNIKEVVLSGGGYYAEEPAWGIHLTMIKDKIVYIRESMIKGRIVGVGDKKVNVVVRPKNARSNLSNFEEVLKVAGIKVKHGDKL